MLKNIIKNANLACSLRSRNCISLSSVKNFVFKAILLYKYRTQDTILGLHMSDTKE